MSIQLKQSNFQSLQGQNSPVEWSHKKVIKGCLAGGLQTNICYFYKIFVGSMWTVVQVLIGADRENSLSQIQCLTRPGGNGADHCIMYKKEELVALAVSSLSSLVIAFLLSFALFAECNRDASAKMQQRKTHQKLKKHNNANNANRK